MSLLRLLIVIFFLRSVSISFKTNTDILSKARGSKHSTLQNKLDTLAV